MTGPTSLPARKQSRNTFQNPQEITSDVAHILYCNSSTRRSLCRMCVEGGQKGNQHSSGCGLLLAAVKT